MNEARRRTKRVWDVVTAIYSEQTGTRSNEDTEEVDRHKHTCWEQSNGRKCLIDMAVRGVQRPGCSRGNKNRRGSCFMLYILLISCNNTAVGIRERERERRKSDGLPHGLLDDDISSDNGGHIVHEHLSTWSWRQKETNDEDMTSSLRIQLYKLMKKEGHTASGWMSRTQTRTHTNSQHAGV